MVDNIQIYKLRKSLTTKIKNFDNIVYLYDNLQELSKNYNIDLDWFIDCVFMGVKSFQKSRK